MKSRAFAVAALLVAAGCGGGGSGAPQTPAVAQPSSSPSSVQQTAKLVLSFPVGAKPSSTKRNPQYVSTNSVKVTVLVNSVNGVLHTDPSFPSWVPYSTTTNLVIGANCTVASGTESCTIPVAAPPGTVNYTFTVGDNATPSNDLATYTGNLAITQGSANATLSVTLNGIPWVVNVSGAALAANSAPSGNAETLTVKVLDPSGALIVSPGNYSTPITLKDSDATGVTSLSVNGGLGASTAVVNSPSDVVTLNYNGQALNQFNITATGTGVQPGGGGTIGAAVQDVTFTGTTLDDAMHGGLNSDPNWGQDTVFFAQASGLQVIGPVELGFTNAPYSQNFDVTLSGGCAAIASITSGPATSFTVTALGSPGVCSGRFTEHGTGYPLTNHPNNVAGSPTHDGTFWISVTTATVGVTGRVRHN
jgi:hypothetical protein